MYERALQTFQGIGQWLHVKLTARSCIYKPLRL